MIVSTPVQKISEDIFVKREDLACPSPGPPFAKVRGLYPVLQKLQKEGIEIFGYIDTSISMAGWGLSYFCKKMGLKAVIFYPEYKDGPRDNQLFQFKKWKKFGAEIIPLKKPNRLMINWYRARKILTDKYPNSKMLPQGLPFNETVENVSLEIIKDCDSFRDIKTIVASAGSGVMIAGILKGLHATGLSPDIYGILISPKSTEVMRKKIFKMSGLKEGGLFGTNINVKIIDSSYEYTDKEMIKIPFPCNPYYDAKAWKWLLNNLDKLKKPVCFWNIGA